MQNIATDFFKDMIIMMANVLRNYPLPPEIAAQNSRGSHYTQSLTFCTFSECSLKDNLMMHSRGRNM